MNLIFLSVEDWFDRDCVIVGGRRYEHLVRVLKAEVGDDFRVGQMNGRIGTGTVEAINSISKQMTLRVALSEDPPPPSPITLILAMPRPLVFRRALVHAVTLGIKQIVMIGSERVEKSYFHTPLLSENKMKEICIEALEQAVDTVLPEIRVRPSWGEFVEQEVELLHSDAVKFLPHPRLITPHPNPLPTGISFGHPQGERERNTLILAIGPEGGFVDPEVAQFERWGFKRMSLGERILRVETALCVAIAQVQDALLV